jgi:hypothetical protein
MWTTGTGTVAVRTAAETVLHSGDPGMMNAGADRSSQGRVLQNRVKHKEKENVQVVNRVKRAKKTSQQLAAKKGWDGGIVPRSRVQRTCEIQLNDAKPKKYVRALSQPRHSPTKREWFADFEVKSMRKIRAIALGLHTAKLAKERAPGWGGENRKLGQREKEPRCESVWVFTVRAVQPDSESPLWSSVTAAVLTATVVHN